MKPILPVLNFDPVLLLKAQPVRLAIFDVDGVLTDGSIYLSDQGETLKRFHTHDGLGMKLLARAGIVPAVISGRDSAALRARLAALGVEHFTLGTEVKLGAAETLLDTLGMDWSQAAVMGDDWPDLPLMQRATVSAAPPQAHPQALACADHVTRASAGFGAAREFCDLLLVATGRYAALLDALDGGASS